MSDFLKGGIQHMKKLETNDWIMLNSIIYKIYTMKILNRCGRNC